MKRLKFKKPFNGMDNALKLIPESYKVDGNEFEITDGNETYRVKWESSINEATVLTSTNKTQINEDMQKMKHLMGYKSQETLGTVKGSARLDEDAKFGDIWNKTKSLLSESEEKEEEVINEMTGGYGFTGEGNLEGMTEMETEETDTIEEVENPDVEALGQAMADSTKVQTAAKKINTRDEKIEASVEYVKMVVGDDKALASKIAREILKNSGEADGEIDNEVSQDTSMTNEELENPEKADLNKDGEISSYEEKRGEAVEKAIEKDKLDEIFEGLDDED